MGPWKIPMFPLLLLMEECSQVEFEEPAPLRVKQKTRAQPSVTARRSTFSASKVNESNSRISVETPRKSIHNRQHLRAETSSIEIIFARRMKRSERNVAVIQIETFLCHRHALNKKTVYLKKHAIETTWKMNAKHNHRSTQRKVCVTWHYEEHNSQAHFEKGGLWGLVQIYANVVRFIYWPR